MNDCSVTLYSTAPFAPSIVSDSFLSCGVCDSRDVCLPDVGSAMLFLLPIGHNSIHDSYKDKDSSAAMQMGKLKKQPVSILA